MKKNPNFFWSNYTAGHYLIELYTEKVTKKEWREVIKNTAF